MWFFKVVIVLIILSLFGLTIFGKQVCEKDNILVIFTAISSIIAVLAVSMNLYIHKQNQQKEIDFFTQKVIFDSLQSESMQELLLITREIKVHFKGQKITLKYLEEEIPRKEIYRIVDLFNIYENIALGIKNKTLSESVLKSYWKTTYINDWIDFKDFTFDYRMQTNHRNSFCEYESLVYKWASVIQRKNMS